MPVRKAFANLLIALAVIVTVTGAALAQRPFSYNRGATDGRNVAGQFDYYALVLSWSPSFCANQRSENYEPQCDRQDGKRYSFVLHGLWPQFSPKGWPQDCPVQGRSFVPRGLINSMLDIMPNDKLVIHEYRKHGTCSGMEPPQYFSFARKLFNDVKIPEGFRNPFETRFLRPSDVVAEFTQANPQLRPDMIGVDCGGTGNRLTEIRICFSKDGRPTACSHNEDQKRLCKAPRMYVPPVRATKLDAPAQSPQPRLPRPGLIPNARNI